MKVLVALLCIVIAFLLVLCIKNNRTYECMTIISNAIMKYRLDMLHKNLYDEMDYVDYTHMRGYDETLFRLFDWGYKRILPPEKYELIKPFIVDDKKEKKK